MKIAVFGLGYVGCVSLGCLAQNGHMIIGVDVVKSKVDLVNQGRPTIIEKDIDKIIGDQHNKGNISATNDYVFAVQESEISIICVGTPSTGSGHLNLDYVYNTASQIAEVLKTKKEYHTIAIRSTVMPGTNIKVCAIIEEITGFKKDVDFGVVSNPEFLREGSAVYDYFNPPVTVIGSSSAKSLEIMESVYSTINAPIKKVEPKVAELIKYVNNSFHALKITFANEIGNICKVLGVDSHEVMDLFVMDNKLNLSPYYLKPGFAYGGSCLPKDLKGLKTIAHDNYLKSPVLESVENSNNFQKQKVIDMISDSGIKELGILGLSFKPGTDDLRYSPIIDVAEYFIGKGYNILIYDKNISLSKLTGTNRSYIEKHIPHLSQLIRDNLQTVILKSKLIIITHKLSEFEGIIEKYPDKKFIDLARITNKTSEHNYEGVCW